jgi:hypothetical protein
MFARIAMIRPATMWSLKRDSNANYFLESGRRAVKTFGCDPADAVPFDGDRPSTSPVSPRYVVA